LGHQPSALEKGVMPEPATVRSEEFINAFDYRDPEPPPGVPIAFAWERARYPFAHNRDLLRFSVKTAAAGRQAGRPLNLVLLLDNSGSMERADRVQIIHEALRVLANLGNVYPDALKQKVEAHRKQGIALDCFGIGWDALANQHQPGSHAAGGFARWQSHARRNEPPLAARARRG
jgi:hypothetical protein